MSISLRSNAFKVCHHSIFVHNMKTNDTFSQIIINVSNNFQLLVLQIIHATVKVQSASVGNDLNCSVNGQLISFCVR